MEIVLRAQNNRLSLLHALLHVRPLPRELERGFDCLGAGVHRQNHVVAKHLRHDFCESPEYGVVERARGEGEFLRLVDEGLHNSRMAMTLEEYEERDK